MSKDLNKVMLTGYLGADPEMRYTPNGSAVTSFRVASGRSWKNAAGEQQDETEWFKITAWEKLGEICNQYLTKGTRVYVEGRLRTSKYQDKETGQDRYSTEVIASDMIILSSKRDAESGGAAEEQAEPQPVRTNGAPPQGRGPAPRAAAAAPARPAARNVPQVVDNDEDLPF